MTDYNELIEQYKKKLRQNASATDYSSLYESSAEALMKAQNASYESRVSDLNAQIPQIEQEYDEARNAAYQNARLSAVRSNESLAALGLAGNLQDSAKSGVSESSRIAQDNALRQSINLLNAEQLKRENEIKALISDAGYDNDKALAGILSEYADKLADYRKTMQDFQLELQKYEQSIAEFEYQKQQDEADSLFEKERFEHEKQQNAADSQFEQEKLEYQKQKDAAELLLKEQEFEYQKQQDLAENAYQQQIFAQELKQTAIENAMKEISVFGKIMTQESADALGMPIGTMSYTVEQKMLKSQSSSSGGGSSKSGSTKLSEKLQKALDGAQQRMKIATDTYSAAYTASLYGISASELPAYQANQYLSGLVRNHTITEKQAEKIKGILDI